MYTRANSAKMQSGSTDFSTNRVYRGIKAFFSRSFFMLIISKFQSYVQLSKPCPSSDKYISFFGRKYLNVTRYARGEIVNGSRAFINGSVVSTENQAASSRSDQMTVRSSPRYNDIFSPNPRTISGTFLRLSSSPSLFLLFLRTIRHRSLSCVAVVEQEETDWHSVDDAAHIDEGSLLLLLSPPAVLLLERGPGFASHFFRASRSSIFEPQSRRPLPDRSDRCGNNYRRTLTRALSRNKSKNHVKFRCSVMTFDHATEKGLCSRSSPSDDSTIVCVVRRW